MARAIVEPDPPRADAAPAALRRRGRLVRQGGGPARAVRARRRDRAARRRGRGARAAPLAKTAARRSGWRAGFDSARGAARWRWPRPRGSPGRSEAPRWCRCGPPTARPATRRASSAASSRRSSTARWTWASTRRRTCRASCRRDSRSWPSPGSEDPADAYVGAAASLEEVAAGSPRGDLEPPAPGAAPGPPPRPRGGRAARQRRHPARQARGRRGRRDRAGRRRAAPARPRGRDLVRLRARGDDPGARPGLARARGAIRRRAERHGSRAPARPRLGARAHGRAGGHGRAGRDLQHAGRRAGPRRVAAS